jgi:lipopolysaccharide export LptBFGC system permease protein LptF
MKKRWAFFLSVTLGGLALFLQFQSVGDYLEASKRVASHFDPATGIETPAPHNSLAEALFLRSKMASNFGVPVAAMSALCLFLSHRRKEPAWRWIVGLLLCLYSYLLLGPI